MAERAALQHRTRESTGPSLWHIRKAKGIPAGTEIVRAGCMDRRGVDEVHAPDHKRQSFPRVLPYGAKLDFG
jgi:hypothetical protein